MISEITTIQVITIALSEVFAVWLIWRVWNSDEYTLLKIGFSVIALIPVAGPLAVLWIANFPPIQPDGLKDSIGGYSARFTQKWLDVFRAKTSKGRYKKYRRAIDKDDDI